MFVPIFGDLGAFLRHILLHVGTFRQMLGLWGSLEASRGGMLEVIAMLKALLLLFYLFFAVKAITDLGPTSIRLFFVEAWLCFAASLRLSWGISLISLAIFTHCSQNMLWALLRMWGSCRFPCFSELVCRLT